MKPHRLDLLIIIGIFTLALTVRIMVAWSVFQGDLAFLNGDDDDYYRIAVSLVETGRFADGGHATAYRMPFFPLFLAFWHAILGTQPYAVLPVLLVLGSLIPVGTYWLARSIADRKVGLVAGLLVVMDADLIVYSRLYMTETLFTFLVLFSLLASVRLRIVRTWQWAVITGLLFACATLTRANFGPFVAIVLVWLVITGRDRLALALRHASIIAAIVVLSWPVWVVRNYLVFDSFIPFTTQGGNAYYGVYNDQSIDPARGFNYGYWLALTAPLPATPGKVWDEVALDSYQGDMARQWISAHPQEALKVRFMQIVHFWRPESSLDSYLFITIPGLFALLIQSWRTRHPDLLLWALLVVTMTLLAAVTIGVGRFNLPLHPVLAITAAVVYTAAAGWIMRFLRSRRAAFSSSTLINKNG